MNRRLQLLHEQLGKLFIPIMAIMMGIIIMLLGYRHVQPQTYHFNLNQVADETILAPTTLEDVEQTKMNQQKARDAIKDIYLYQEDIRTQELTRIEQFFSWIRELRNEQYNQSNGKKILERIPSEEVRSNFSDQIQKLPDKEVSFAELTEEQKMIVVELKLQTSDVLVKELFEQLSNRSIDQMINISALELSELQSNLTDFTSESLDQEIRTDQVGQVVENLRLQMEASSMAPLAKSTTLNFLQFLIRPTVVYSKQETERLKNEAAAEVQPFYVLQGQVIVQEGHVVTRNNLRHLQMYGYLDAATKKYLLPVFTLLVLIHSLLFIYLLSNRLRWTDLKKANIQATAYLIVMIGYLFMIKMAHLMQRAGLDYAFLLVPMMMFPAYLRIKSSEQVTIFASLFINLLSLFIISDQDNQTITIFICLSYLFTSLIALFKTTLNHRLQKEERHLVSNLLWQMMVTITLMSILNIPFLSHQALIIYLMVLAANLVEVVLLALLLPYWEQLLSSRSAMTMNQLANLNHPLLKLLIEKAPGTYHHSIMVANLAANAVEAIGGDSLTTRVASYYHDVGKTVHPLFFVENLSGGIESPHRMVGPDESAKIIIDHVAQGVKLLEQHYMPESIIDLCREHHGTTLTTYFYHQAKELKMPLTQDDFRYPGPIPQSKESAVVMIADSLEAASRTLPEHTQAGIENLIDRIIKGKLEDGQFAECGLTVDELRIVRKSLILGIASMYHTRVEYPK